MRPQVRIRIHPETSRLTVSPKKPYVLAMLEWFLPRHQSTHHIAYRVGLFHSNVTSSLTDPYARACDID